MNWLQKIIKTSSVTFSIVGSHKISQPKTILDLTHDLAQWGYDNIPHDVFKANYSNIVPDGDAWDQFVGTMNWYAENPQAVIPYIQTAIQTELQPMGIQAHVREVNASRMYDMQAIRVEVTANETQHLEQLPEINIANGNYYQLNRLLQLEPGEDYSGSISAQDMLARISIARGQTDMYTRAPTDTGGPGTGMARNIDYGLNQGQLNRYLDVLEQMAEYALNMNNATIHWG